MTQAEEEGSGVPGAQENKPSPVMIALEGSEEPGRGREVEVLDERRGEGCEEHVCRLPLMTAAMMMVMMRAEGWMGRASARTMIMFFRLTERALFPKKSAFKFILLLPPPLTLATTTMSHRVAGEGTSRTGGG